MKIINNDYIIEENNKFWVDMWDVISGEEVGWKSNERFKFWFNGMLYSGVVKDEDGIWEVYCIEDVEKV